MALHMPLQTEGLSGCVICHAAATKTVTSNYIFDECLSADPSGSCDTMNRKCWNSLSWQLQLASVSCQSWTHDVEEAMLHQAVSYKEGRDTHALEDFQHPYRVNRPLQQQSHDMLMSPILALIHLTSCKCLDTYCIDDQLRDYLSCRSASAMVKPFWL